MILDELKRALHTKGCFYEERVSEETRDIPTLWARDRAGRDYHLGARESVLALSLAQFMQAQMYTQIGRTRDELIEKFVLEVFHLFDVLPDAVEKANLTRRTLRLYDELRRADW